MSGEKTVRFPLLSRVLYIQEYIINTPIYVITGEREGQIRTNSGRIDGIQGANMPSCQGPGSTRFKPRRALKHAVAEILQGPTNLLHQPILHNLQIEASGMGVDRTKMNLLFDSPGLLKGET